jgi:hypothetical protein
MHRIALAVLALVSFAACNNKPAPSPTTSSTGSEPVVSQAAPATQTATSAEVTRKLRDLAGNAATDCGQVASMAPEEVSKASNCAMDSAKAKKAFTVSYAMPGLTIGVAGNSAGKLFTVQSQIENGHETEPKTEQCPAELRIAQSGRVTCFKTGSIGVTPGSGNPHGESPHGGMGAAPAGAPNPHQPAGPITSH